MHMVIEPTDFARLSAGTRAEILKLFEGEPRRSAATRAESAAGPAANGSVQAAARRGFRWRAPHDLNLRLVRRLMRGLDEASEKRLRLFAKNDGRVSARKLLAAGGDKDWKALSTFEGQITRRLRHLVGDENRMVSLMMWDYDSEKWDAGRHALLDGIYYVSPATTKALQAHFGVK